MATICPNTVPKSVRLCINRCTDDIHRKNCPQLLSAPASMTPDYGDVLYRHCPLKLTKICS